MAENRVYGGGGRVWTAGGEISADRAGLWTASAECYFDAGEWSQAPKVGDAHPLAPFLLAEKVRVITLPGRWKAVVDFAGIEAEYSNPVYDLDPGTGTEPIETHRDFIEVLAGTPANPLNGAVFLDKNGNVSKSMEPGVARFDHFAAFIDGAKNPFGGDTGFLEANNTFWIKSWTSKSRPISSNCLSIGTPDGDPPDFGGKYNWLIFPIAMTERGGAWSCQQRSMLSGRNGWNPLIYPD